LVCTAVNASYGNKTFIKTSSCLILSPLTKAQILNKTVLYSISRAWCLGNEVLLARKSKYDPVQAVLNNEGGKRLISGKITDVCRHPR
jgi:DUF917 family protein